MINAALPITVYNLPSLKSIFRNEVSYCQSLDYETKKVAQFDINGDNTILFSDPTDKLLKLLYDNSPKSLVGKGSSTVLDESVRSSKEITKFNINKDFKECVAKQVEKGLKKLKLSRGPRKVLLITNDKCEDISNDIFPYLGTDECLHGIEYTPNFFNQDEMIFQMSNGDEKIFKNNDIFKYKFKYK